MVSKTFFLTRFLCLVQTIENNDVAINGFENYDDNADSDGESEQHEGGGPTEETPEETLQGESPVDESSNVATNDQPERPQRDYNNMSPRRVSFFFLILFKWG